MSRIVSVYKEILRFDSKPEKRVGHGNIQAQIHEIQGYQIPSKVEY